MNYEKIFKFVFELTQSEMDILDCMNRDRRKYYTCADVCKKRHYDLSTPQRAVKRLHEKNLLLRKKHCLKGGGYEFQYKVQSEEVMKEKLKNKLQLIIEGIYSNG